MNGITFLTFFTAGLLLEYREGTNFFNVSFAHLESLHSSERK